MEQVRNTLYAKAKNGKITQWDVFVDGAEVIVLSGYIDGKKKETRYTAVGKNVGRANATTPEQQAVLEAQSKWDVQVQRKQYCESVEDLDNAVEIPLPMLAHSFVDHGDKIVLPAFAQRKLDGVRSIYHANIDMFSSRRGTEYRVPIEMYKEVYIITKELNISRLDGELYIHGMLLQHINSVVKTTTNPSRHLLKYVIYDIPDEDLTFSERYEILERIRHIIKVHNLTHVEVITTEVVNTFSEIDIKLDEYIADGYEGIIIRNSAGKYMFKYRSYDLIKYKKFFDAEFNIIDVLADKMGQAKFLCRTKDNVEFTVRMIGTDQSRIDQYKNADTYINKWITVKYQSLTDDGAPTFGVGICFRDCDSDGNPLE